MAKLDPSSRSAFVIAETDHSPVPPGPPATGAVSLYGRSSSRPASASRSARSSVSSWTASTSTCSDSTRSTTARASARPAWALSVITRTVPASSGSAGGADIAASGTKNGAVQATNPASDAASTTARAGRREKSAITSSGSATSAAQGVNGTSSGSGGTLSNGRARATAITSSGIATTQSTNETRPRTKRTHRTLPAQPPPAARSAQLSPARAVLPRTPAGSRVLLRAPAGSRGLPLRSGVRGEIWSRTTRSHREHQISPRRRQISAAAAAGRLSRTARASAEDRRERALVDLAGLRERDLELALDHQGVAARGAEAEHRDTGLLGEVRQLALVLGVDGDDDAAGRLRKQRDERVHLVAAGHALERHRRTDAEPQRCLEQRLHEATLREVVRRGGQTGLPGLHQGRGQGLLRAQVDLRRQTAEVLVHDVGPRRAVELVPCGAEQEERQALGPPAGRERGPHVVDHAEHTDHGRGVDRRVDLAGLARAVVERDVAAGDRDAELLTGVGEALDRLDELPHRVGVLRGAEVRSEERRVGTDGRPE